MGIYVLKSPWNVLVRSGGHFRIENYCGKNILRSPYHARYSGCCGKLQLFCVCEKGEPITADDCRFQQVEGCLLYST